MALWSFGLHNTQYIQTIDHALKTSSERRDLATDPFEHLDPRARLLQLKRKKIAKIARKARFSMGADTLTLQPKQFVGK